MFYFTGRNPLWTSNVSWLSVVVMQRFARGSQAAALLFNFDFAHSLGGTLIERYGPYNKEQLLFLARLFLPSSFI